MGIMQDIIREAYARRNIAEGEQVELVDVLRAFEFVLRSHGRVPDQDSVHYHLLIKLSKLSIPDWRDKLAWYKQVSWPSFKNERPFESVLYISFPMRFVQWLFVVIRVVFLSGFPC